MRLINDHKIRLVKEDFDHPFRITAPKYSLTTLRFDNIDDATKLFENLKEEGYQAIMSFVNTFEATCKIIGYSYPTKN